ncbi:MAG: fibronectin type III domain-containing protein, partial [Capsulimonadaceae bacterium]
MNTAVCRTSALTVFAQVIAIIALRLLAASPALALSAPTGLTATPGIAQVALSWTGSAGATAYVVYMGTASGGESAFATVGPPPATSYTNTGLASGTIFYYKVAAVNGGGTSPESTEARAMTAPAATSGIGQVTLTWTESSSATSYSVFRGLSSGGESATPIAADQTTGSYANTGLATGTRYYYTVAAINSAGTLAVSGEASMITAPAEPICLTVQAETNENQLVWVGGDDSATSFNIYRSTVSGEEGNTPAGTSTAAYYADNDEQNFPNTGLTNGTVYYYTVAGVNAGGTGPMSVEMSGDPGSTYLPLPTAVAVQPGNGYAVLTWVPVPGATGYLIQSNWSPYGSYQPAP